MICVDYTNKYPFVIDMGETLYPQIFQYNAIHNLIEDEISKNVIVNLTEKI